jgi:hypothetical protein
MSMALFLAAILAGPGAHGPATHATDVRSGFTDDLTEKFAEALRAALPKATHMRLETGDDTDDLYLSLLAPVDSDGKRFDYSVDLLKANPPLTPDRLASFTGTCRQDAIAACAQDLIEKADRKAKD